MRKLLVAMALVSAFALIADAASARPRGMRSSRPVSQPTAVQKSQRPVAKSTKAREASTPRSWTVAVPIRPFRSPRNSTADEPYAATSPDSDSGAPFAAASSPAEAAAAQPAANAPKPLPAASAPEPQPPVRMVVINPPRSGPPAGPSQPHNFAICYWNQAGQCVER